MTLRRIMTGVFPHEESAHCVRNGCVPADTMSRAAAPGTCLARLGEALTYYRDFFGVDPAALPALEGQVVLERLACLYTTAQAVVAAYNIMHNAATIDAFAGAMHALKAVLGEGEARGSASMPQGQRVCLFVKEAYEGNTKVTNFPADVLKMEPDMSYATIAWTHGNGEYKTTLCHKVLLSPSPWPRLDT